MRKTNPRTPDYNLRESGRARRVLLRIRAGSGLEVVVPKGFDTTRVPSIVRARLDWIERATERMRDLGLLRDPEEARILPERLFFAAVGRTLDLAYRQDGRARVSLAGHGTAVVGGPLEDKARMFELLRAFVRREAGKLLPEMLERASQECGLPFAKTSVRMQRTRWGSCSARGNISLNAKLLFLPGDLARYVMVHELCHTRHLNHSKAYWTLVARHQPDYQEMERLLRTANLHVPAWMLPTAK